MTIVGVSFQKSALVRPDSTMPHCTSLGTAIIFIGSTGIWPVSRKGAGLWWVVPLFELAGALEILVSVGESRLLAFLILGLYATLIFYNLIIGRVNLDCGCGGVGTKLSWWMFGRNVALLLVCIPARSRELSWWEINCFSAR